MQPRVRILGAQGEAAREWSEALATAGFAVADSAEAEAVLVAGGDREAGCKEARAASASAGIVVRVEAAGETSHDALRLAGADEIIGSTAAAEVIDRVRAAAALGAARAGRIAAEGSMTAVDEIFALLSSADLAETLAEAAARFAEAVGMTRCSVVALPGDDTETAFVVAASEDPMLVRLPLDLRRYPELRAALDRKEPVFIEDVPSSKLLGEFARLAAAHGGLSLLAVPLSLEHRHVGALLLRSAVPRPPLDQRALRLCHMVGRAFALALRGGRITEALREQTRRISLAGYELSRRARALDQFRDFFESAADGVLVVDSEGRIFFMNRSAEQVTGYSRSGLQGRKLHNLVPDGERDNLTEVVRNASMGVHLAGFDLTIKTTSGEQLRLSVSTSAALAEHGAIVLSFRDVTVARALQDELRKTKEFLERLIDSTVDGIVAADVDGNVMVFNHGAESAYGYSAEEVIGRIPVWKLYPEGAARQMMADIRSPEHGGKGRLSPSRREILNRYGEVVPVSLTASIIYEGKNEVATVGIISDLRERLQMEQKLQQAQEKLAMSEKQMLIAELAGTTAHELNQPLTSVMGYAELLKKRMSPDDPHLRTVEIILRESERIAEIVRKIGKITRYEIKAYVGSTTILDLDKSTTE